MATPANVGNGTDEANDVKATLRAARIAAGAAIVAAIVGLGSAAITGYYNDARSQSDFLRTQQQQTYSNFITDVGRFNRIEAPYGSVLIPESLTEVQMSQLDNDLSTVSASIDRDLGAMEIVAPSETYQLAAQVDEDLFARVYNMRSKFCRSHVSSKLPVCDRFNAPGNSAVPPRPGVPEGPLDQDIANFQQRAHNDISGGK